MTQHPQGVTEPSSGNGTRATDSGPINPAIAFPIVGVGASAGGLETFIELLRQIPPNSGMAFVLIQHLDPTHASYLSEALGRSTKLPVTEVEDGMLVQPDHVYVIPSNADIGIVEGALALSPRSTAGRKPHLPIDSFFNALATDRGNQAIGIVLSGTGADGSQGLRAIKAQDGVTFAQDPGSAKFSGMPEAAIKTGHVDFTLPVPELAQELLRIGRHPFVRGREAELLTDSPDDAESRGFSPFCAARSGSTSAGTSSRACADGWLAGWPCSGWRRFRSTCSSWDRTGPRHRLSSRTC
jgi:chemotaxis response regulator CheB